MSRDVTWTYNHMINHVTYVMNGICEMFVTTSDATVLCDLNRCLIIYSYADGSRDPQVQLKAHITYKRYLLTRV